MAAIYEGGSSKKPVGDGTFLVSYNDANGKIIRAEIQDADGKVIKRL